MASTATNSSGHLPFVFEEGNKDPFSPTIIWLHGGTESHHEYTKVLSYLPKDAYHHILLDLPGHGVLSSSDFSMEIAMNNLELAIQKHAHSKRKCYIVGFSLGGVTALCFFTKSTKVCGGEGVKDICV